MSQTHSQTRDLVHLSDESRTLIADIAYGRADRPSMHGICPERLKQIIDILVICIQPTRIIGLLEDNGHSGMQARHQIIRFSGQDSEMFQQSLLLRQLGKRIIAFYAQAGYLRHKNGEALRCSREPFQKNAEIGAGGNLVGPCDFANALP